MSWCQAPIGVLCENLLHHMTESKSSLTEWHSARELYQRVNDDTVRPLQFWFKWCLWQVIQVHCEWNVALYSLHTTSLVHVIPPSFLESVSVPMHDLTAADDLTHNASENMVLLSYQVRNYHHTTISSNSLLKNNKRESFQKVDAYTQWLVLSFDTLMPHLRAKWPTITHNCRQLMHMQAIVAFSGIRWNFTHLSCSLVGLCW